MRSSVSIACLLKREPGLEVPMGDIHMGDVHRVYCPGERCKETFDLYGLVYCNASQLKADREKIREIQEPLDGPQMVSILGAIGYPVGVLKADPESWGDAWFLLLSKDKITREELPEKVICVLDEEINEVSSSEIESL